MRVEDMKYIIWVDWQNEVVSFHQSPGFEAVHFATESALQANLQIMLSEGFLFQ